MLKKLVNKKIELFKETFPDYKISKGGNFYARQGIIEKKNSVTLLGKLATKNTLNRIGEKREWTTHKASSIYLISPTGRLMHSTGGNYKSVTLKQASQSGRDIQNIFFIGKKYEWLKEYPNLMEYRFFQSFKSLKEAKTFLGYSFLSDKNFYEIFNHPFDCLTPLVKAKDKKAAAKLFSNLDNHSVQILRDYIEVCINNNLEIEVPAGKNRLKELHDNTVWEINKANIDRCSDKEKYYISEGNFEEKWKELGIQFIKMGSPKQMYETGIAQKHCLGSNYSNKLHLYSFYSIIFNDKSYEIQIDMSGEIVQFYGYDNSSPPNELVNRIRHSNIDYKHAISLKPGEQEKEEGYPYLKEFHHIDDVEDLLNNDFDDDYIPW